MPEDIDTELRDRVRKLTEDPVFRQLRDQAGYLPIWAMSGGALAFLATDYALKTGRVRPSSPRVMKIGEPGLLGHRHDRNRAGFRHGCTGLDGWSAGGPVAASARLLLPRPGWPADEGGPGTL